MSRIVVLGGGGIIGRAIAQDLAKDVAEVIVADLDMAGAQEVTKAVGRECVARQVDVTDPDSLDAALRGAERNWVWPAKSYPYQGCGRSSTRRVDYLAQSIGGGQHSKWR